MEKINVADGYDVAPLSHGEAFLLLQEMENAKRAPAVTTANLHDMCRNSDVDISKEVLLMDGEPVSLLNGKLSLDDMDVELSLGISFFLSNVLMKKDVDNILLFKVLFDLSFEDEDRLDDVISGTDEQIEEVATRIMESKRESVVSLVELLDGRRGPLSDFERKIKEKLGCKYVEKSLWVEVVNDNAKEIETIVESNEECSNLYFLSDKVTGDTISMVKDINNIMDELGLKEMVMDRTADWWVCRSLAQKYAVILPNCRCVLPYSYQGPGMYTLDSNQRRTDFVRCVISDNNYTITDRICRLLGKNFFSICRIQPTYYNVFPSARARDRMIITDIGKFSYRVKDMVVRSREARLHLQRSSRGGLPYACYDNKYKFMRWSDSVFLSRYMNDYTFGYRGIARGSYYFSPMR